MGALHRQLEVIEVRLCRCIQLYQDARRHLLIVGIGADTMGHQLEGQWQRQHVGLGRRKDILIPTDHYDVLALVALEPNVIQFVNAKDVNKKTYRTKPENMHAGLTGDTWRAITNAL